MSQVGPFLVIVYGVEWGLFFILRPLALEGEQWPALAWLLPTVWAPTIAALILAGLSRGATEMRAELRARLTNGEGSWRWIVLAVTAPPAASLLAVFSARAVGDNAPFIPSAAIPMMLVVQLLTGAVGEEFGWRGFLLPRLGNRLGETTAAVAMGILWGLWHLPAFFFPGMPHEMMPLVLNILFTASFGVFLAFVFYRTGGSVLVTILAHLAVNITSGVGGVELSSIVFWRTMVGLYGALALIVVVASRTRPTRLRLGST